MNPSPLFAPLPASLVQPPRAARTVEFNLRVILPASTPMLDVAEALTRLAESVGGTWCYRQPSGAPRGRFEVEVTP